MPWNMNDIWLIVRETYREWYLDSWSERMAWMRFRYKTAFNASSTINNLKVYLKLVIRKNSFCNSSTFKSISIQTQYSSHWWMQMESEWIVWQSGQKSIRCCSTAFFHWICLPCRWLVNESWTVVECGPSERWKKLFQRKSVLE